MTPGTRVRLPDGREALVVGATDLSLHVSVIVPNWPFPAPPEWVSRDAVKRMPSRYLRETPEDVGEARW
jgi:hypothetical protein